MSDALLGVLSAFRARPLHHIRSAPCTRLSRWDPHLVRMRLGSFVLGIIKNVSMDLTNAAVLVNAGFVAILGRLARCRARDGERSHVKASLSPEVYESVLHEERGIEAFLLEITEARSTRVP